MMKFDLRYKFLIIALVSIDQLSKWVVETHLLFRDKVDVFPFLALFRTHNKGIAFSMLSSMDRILLIGLIFLIILFLLNLWENFRINNHFSHFGFAILISGAIGNLIDRLMRGHVVDFLLFYTENWAFPVFNAADSFITLGAIAVILDKIVFNPNEKRRSEKI
ncbi:signal peptidase II [Candidatus Endowatersipora endosymbiont of Watersipora subatra]|uniref:signal peptidase II n=1 Tax=Candidatus Endowatersipora endosymbiont of Watersipora subatra TaxID=3077946 RepID=UPI00312CA217